MSLAPSVEPSPPRAVTPEARLAVERLVHAELDLEAEAEPAARLHAQEAWRRAYYEAYRLTSEGDVISAYDRTAHRTERWLFITPKPPKRRSVS